MTGGKEPYRFTTHGQRAECDCPDMRFRNRKSRGHTDLCKHLALIVKAIKAGKLRNSEAAG